MTRDLVLGVWAALGAVVVACVILSVGAGRRLPTFGALIDRATRRPVWRVLLLVGWMWLGWHFFAR